MRRKKLKSIRNFNFFLFKYLKKKRIARVESNDNNEYSLIILEWRIKDGAIVVKNVAISTISFVNRYWARRKTEIIVRIPYMADSSRPLYLFIVKKLLKIFLKKIGNGNWLDFREISIISLFELWAKIWLNPSSHGEKPSRLRL